MTVKTVGLDLAKDVIQVHCVSATGRKIINKKIKRAKLLAFFETLPRCVVGMEACGSAHHWGRELRKLGHVHMRLQFLFDPLRQFCKHLSCFFCS